MIECKEIEEEEYFTYCFVLVILVITIYSSNLPPMVLITDTRAVSSSSDSLVPDSTPNLLEIG